MKVLKFGGSSVANATRMSAALDIVEAAGAEDCVVLVSSAVSGCTDALIGIGNRAAAGDESYREAIRGLRERHARIVDRLFSGTPRGRVQATLDAVFLELETLSDGIFRSRALAPGQAEAIQTFGEIFSTRILSAKLSCEGNRVCWLDARELFVRGDEAQTLRRIRAEMRRHRSAHYFVVPGFIARDAQGRVCTLGRGGSDYSAALLAAATGASECQIWTDVPGVMTSNPKVVSAAVTIPQLSYESAFCMAEHGAKVLYAPTVAPAQAAGIPIIIRNTFDPAHPGTRIERIAPRQVTEWVGVSNMRCGENERITLTVEGPLDVEAAFRRAEAALRDAGIAAVASAQEPGCITLDVRPGVSREACCAIHREFFEVARLNVVETYVAGRGAVGTELQKLVRKGLATGNGREVQIRGISSSHDFAARVLKTAPRHAVFVDCTDSEDIYRYFVPMLEKGINIVSSNRRSFAVPYVEYAAIRQAALRNGCFVRYNTTVGTALPVLESIVGGANCDGLVSIEAVVSCTLNHIITGYDGANTESFATLLRKAQQVGLTEQDPRLDLGGKDALRKLLILAREAGVPLEEEDVQITPMLPPEFFDCPLDEFYARLEASEPDFIRREAELDAMGRRQRFVASLRRDPAARHGYRAEIRMQLVGIESPFYWISGTENVMIIRSEAQAPLVIKGAGEGARQAAAGVLNDILK